VVAPVKLFTIREAASNLGLRPSSLYDPRFRAKHGLRVLRLGRSLRFEDASLRAFVARLRRQATTR
jgi:hypothetical protein